MNPNLMGIMRTDHMTKEPGGRGAVPKFLLPSASDLLSSNINNKKIHPPIHPSFLFPFASAASCPCQEAISIKTPSLFPSFPSPLFLPSLPERTSQSSRLAPPPHCPPPTQMWMRARRKGQRQCDVQAYTTRTHNTHTHTQARARAPHTAPARLGVLVDGSFTAAPGRGGWVGGGSRGARCATRPSVGLIWGGVGGGRSEWTGGVRLQQQQQRRQHPARTDTVCR